MTSLDLRVDSVQGVLVRLRTRSGINAVRLRQTEVDIRPILELPVVRRYIHTSGSSPIDALVHSIRQLATQLAPTDILIVDAALALGLLRDMIPDHSSAARLYAADLGDRRAQLVEKWSELHELLGVQAIPAPPSIRTLRSTLEPHALRRLAHHCVTSSTLETARAPDDAGGYEESAARSQHASHDPAAVTIIGAAVMDHIYVVDHIPSTGTSVQATSYAEHPGGKGLNQAVASSRLGLDVDLIAAIGDDASSEVITGYLRSEGVRTELIKRATSASSPSSCVLVTRTGSSAAVGWKNHGPVRLTTEDLRNADMKAAIRTAAAVILTFELSMKPSAPYSR